MITRINYNAISQVTIDDPETNIISIIRIKIRSIPITPIGLKTILIFKVPEYI